MKTKVDATKLAVSGFRGRRDTAATSWVVALASFALFLAAACDPAPHATSEKSVAPDRASNAGKTASAVTPPSSAAPLPAASSAASDPCPELRKTVVAEAGKLAACKTDTDCKVHPVTLCGFVELDCYAAHVNKASSTADFDGAVSAYAKSCSPSKCKCEIPSKSVCNNGKCAAK